MLPTATRWGHSGYQEQHPEEFASSGDEGEEERRRKKRKRREAKRKKRKKGHTHCEAKPKKRYKFSSSSDASSDTESDESKTAAVKRRKSEGHDRSSCSRGGETADSCGDRRGKKPAKKHSKRK